MPAEGEAYHVADYPVAPLSGFVAVASAPLRALLIRRITMRGTISTMWREDRTNYLRAIAPVQKDPDEKEEKN